jgi:insulysin
VKEKFTPIVNKDIVVPPLGDPSPFPESHRKKLVKFVPVKDKDSITLMFILPYCEDRHKTQPYSYFSALIGHEGENSLLSFLKHENLALELSAGADHSMDSLSMFEIDITLTKQGIERYEDVISIVF